jgi:hypothetical protein
LEHVFPIPGPVFPRPPKALSLPKEQQGNERVFLRGKWARVELISYALFLPPPGMGADLLPNRHCHPASFFLKGLMHLDMAGSNCPEALGTQLAQGSTRGDVRRRNAGGPQGASWHAGSCQVCHLIYCFSSPGFQPKVQSRLVGGSGVCEGTVEVRQGTRWAALCDSPVARGQGRWEELCQEQQCGRFISFHMLDASGTSRGLTCPQEKLSRCYALQEKKAFCRRVFITCELLQPTVGRGQLWTCLLGTDQ